MCWWLFLTVWLYVVRLTGFLKSFNDALCAKILLYCWVPPLP